MDREEYTKLLQSYENSATKICIEKCCDYRFIFFLNNEATLNDLYNYVTTFYSHVTEPILLYLDKYHNENEGLTIMFGYRLAFTASPGRELFAIC